MGVDVFAVIRDVEAHDVHAAACLWLMVAFGLRFKESLMLRHMRMWPRLPRRQEHRRLGGSGRRPGD